MKDRVDLKRPGLFSVQVAADSRRGEFDCKNEVIITNKIPIDFVFIGDSITQMWELNAYYGKTDRLILNRGIGGDTTEYLLKRYEADVLQLRPKYCVLKVGINDAWALEPDLVNGKEGKSIEEIVKKVLENISNIVDLSVYNNQKLIICSILPTNMIFTLKNKERNEYVLKANSHIRQMCVERSIIYVDFHSHFVDKDGITLKNGLTMEGLHPHVYGYNVMAELLKKTLKDYDIEI